MKMTVKGQITLPQELRERYGLRPGEEVELEATDCGILVRPGKSAKERLRQWAKRARGSATPGRSTDEILRLTRGE